MVSPTAPPTPTAIVTPTSTPSSAPSLTPVASTVIVCNSLMSGFGFLCDRMADAAIAGARSVGYPITRVTVQRDTICLGDPFDPIPCPLGLPDGAKTVLGSAIVEFAGVAQRAYLNLYATASGNIVNQMRLWTPPATTPTAGG